ncbi:MAG: hypothetical protein TQ37_00790 [Candidatus Synechococcus spongiarum 15L]|uniref:DUF502 domain-containing protein n=1 Tax=Candidatus Synechococcus spongiarum 15L TaxID=1608419 RepID=A0A0G8AYW2_9SYNE|nr:MAG: hypothetical protein TQ37_00790 [Candidatus Synechococcus spongiarum 15L]
MPESRKDIGPGPLVRLRNDLKNDLLTGLAVVIPLATTLWLSTIVARWAVEFLTSVPKQFNPLQTQNPLLLSFINLMVGLVVPLLGILLIGLAARIAVVKPLVAFGEDSLIRIPLAGTVYKTLKQLLETLLRDNASRFRRVVLVEYPREGIFALAFVTGSAGRSLQPLFPEPMINIFIPTSPNPTTGWYALVAEKDVKTLDIPVDMAFRTIISAGILSPDQKSSAPSEGLYPQGPTISYSPSGGA